MGLRPPGLMLAFAAALVALALVPGSMSAVDGGSSDALDVALAYLDKNAGELGVTSADVSDLVVTSRYRSSHNGVTHVNLNQHFRALEVFGGHVTVNVADDGSVVFAGGNLARGLADSPSGTAGVEPTAAVSDLCASPSSGVSIAPLRPKVNSACMYS